MSAHAVAVDRRTPATPRRAPAAQSVAAAIAATIIGAYAVIALLAPLLAPLDPNAVNLIDRMKPPGATGLGLGRDRAAPLGTDSLGRDVLTRVVHGARVSLGVGFAAVFISGVIGTTFGLVAGYWRGWIDHVLGRVMDIQLAFPSIVLAIVAIAFLRPGIWNVIGVLGIAGWVTYARVVRAETLAAREREYVEAARAIGAGTGRILRAHILPNIGSPLLVIASFAIASTIIAEASLSFLGLGLPPSVPSWGGMLADAREHIDDGWWLAVVPGVAIVSLVLSINVVGDWLRDRFDPRLGARKTKGE